MKMVQIGETTVVIVDASEYDAIRTVLGIDQPAKSEKDGPVPDPVGEAIENAKAEQEKGPEFRELRTLKEVQEALLMGHMIWTPGVFDRFHGNEDLLRGDDRPREIMAWRWLGKRIGQSAPPEWILDAVRDGLVADGRGVAGDESRVEWLDVKTGPRAALRTWGLLPGMWIVSTDGDLSIQRGAPQWS
jgi:hypothetical protein